MQWDFFPNIFYLRLVESMAAEHMNTEGPLYIMEIICPTQQKELPILGEEESGYVVSIMLN
jgi:hypothetical protein